MAKFKGNPFLPDTSKPEPPLHPLFPMKLPRAPRPVKPKGK